MRVGTTTIKDLRFGTKHPELDSITFSNESFTVIYSCKEEASLDEIPHRIKAVFVEYSNAIFIQENDMMFQEIFKFQEILPNLFDWVITNDVNKFMDEITDSIESYLKDYDVKIIHISYHGMNDTIDSLKLIH